jgi:hypothetical protein
MTSAIALERRRARAHKLRAEGLSVRQIAAKLGVSPSTAHADLSATEPRPDPAPNIQTPDGQPVAGAEAGNTRAMTHGVHSEKRVAPLREKHVVALRESYPRLDDRRLVMLADRLARIEAASAWLDGQEGIVRDADGEVYAVVKELEKWTTRAEQVLAIVEAEHRASDRWGALGRYLDGDGGDDDDEPEGGDDGDQ